ERFERTFSANPAPAVICRLDDLRYVKVNQGFLDMTGHVRDDLLGKSADEIGLWAERGARQHLDGQLARDGNVRNTDV
ncbi:PAS domain-containing protein, partial [Burkholderia anthina]|uniref:PAS domain-containing protein n=1 Tax=Burkholderia anthina TaxID=179879 RepID=UPI001589B81B